MIAALYTDGGVIGRNPSSVGGTWAWCQVDENGVLGRWLSGIVEPIAAGLATITNNYTELLAAVEGLEKLPASWDGTVYTDSQVTLYRISKDRAKAKYNGIPAELVARVKTAKERLGAYKVVLLGGHPTRAELAAGVRKDGYPCSQHNVFCDKLCGQQAEYFKLYGKCLPTQSA